MLENLLDVRGIQLNKLLRLGPARIKLNGTLLASSAWSVCNTERVGENWQSSVC